MKGKVRREEGEECVERKGTSVSEPVFPGGWVYACRSEMFYERDFNRWICSDV